MLQRLYVDNYRHLVNFELRLQELSLLLGRNGAGKTSVLDVVLAIRRLLNGTARVTDPDTFPTKRRLGRTSRHLLPPPRTDRLPGWKLWPGPESRDVRSRDRQGLRLGSAAGQ